MNTKTRKYLSKRQKKNIIHTCTICIVIMGECYVCMENCYSLSPCGCTQLYLHGDCLTLLIEYGNRYCKVCNTDYPSECIVNSTVGPINNNILWYILPTHFRSKSFSKTRKWLCIDYVFDFLRYFCVVWITASITQLNILANPLVDIYNIDYLHVWVFCSIFMSIALGGCYIFTSKIYE